MQTRDTHISIKILDIADISATFGPFWGIICWVPQPYEYGEQLLLATLVHSPKRTFTANRESTDGYRGK
jgi:hypothetical protein